MSAAFPATLLCEQIIQDIHNKHSLIGIYTGDVVVSNFPAHLRLALFVTFVPPKDGSHNLEITLSLGADEYAKTMIGMANSKEGELNMIPLPGFELGIVEASELKVTAKVDDDEEETILVKKIYKGDIPLSRKHNN